MDYCCECKNILRSQCTLSNMIKLFSFAMFANISLILSSKTHAFYYLINIHDQYWRSYLYTSLFVHCVSSCSMFLVLVRAFRICEHDMLYFMSVHLQHSYWYHIIFLFCPKSYVPLKIYLNYRFKKFEREYSIMRIDFYLYFIISIYSRYSICVFMQIFARVLVNFSQIDNSDRFSTPWMYVKLRKTYLGIMREQFLFFFFCDNINAQPYVYLVQIFNF